MDAYDEWKDSDEESEQEEEETVFTFKPSYILIAIDTGESMFTTNGSDHSAFMESLKACYQVAHSLVMADRTSIKGPLGIVLAENDSTRAGFIEFEQPVPDTIKVLKDLKNLSDEELKDKYKRKSDFDLADFFLLCKNKLVQVNADVYKRTVIYITNDDDPVQNDARQRFKVINESMKFPSVQMELKVMTFKNNFDYENLYSEVLSASNSPPVEEVKSTVSLADKLITLVQTKCKKYRYKLYPFKGDKDSYIDVVVNKFIQSQNITKNMYVTRDMQKEVKKSVKQQQYSVRYLCKYTKSEDPLIFDQAEKDALFETSLPIGYSLFYVGEETSKYGWVLEPAMLIEKHHKETEPVFDYFWQFCKEKSKCLICLRKYKKCGDVRLVEMVPRLINNTRMFLTRVLPFNPEILHPVLPKQEDKFDSEEEEAMNALVEALTFDFHPRNFRDPVIAKKKAYIQSQLLEEPLEEVTDGVPTDEEMDQRIAVEIEHLKSLGLIDTPPSAKRGGDSKRGIGGSRKKLKVETD